MAQFEQRDKHGITAIISVDDALLKSDPETVLKSRGPRGSAAPAAPTGYDHIASLDGDVDAMVSDCTVHVYAKKGSYRKEEPSGLAALKAKSQPAATTSTEPAK